MDRRTKRPDFDPMEDRATAEPVMAAERVHSHAHADSRRP